MTAVRPKNLKRLDFAFVVLVSVVAIVSNLWARAPSVLSSDWVFREGSWVLNAATTVLKGQSLYHDIQWNYGPFPVYYYAVFAAILGNSPAVFLFSNAVMYALSLGFLYIALTKYLTRFQACIGLAIGSLPFVLAASIQGENTAPFEFLCLSIIAALYEPPIGRNLRASFLLGAVAGASQWTKFGSGVAAAVAIVLLDLIAQCRSADRVRRPLFLRGLFSGIAGFMSVEIAREVFHFCTLPLPFARDATFPLYIKDWYGAYITPTIRFPVYITPAFLVGVQLPILVGLCCGIGIILSGPLRRQFTNSRMSDFPYAICIAPLYYCLGLAGYFRHVFHFLQYGFLVGTAAGYVLVCSKGWLRTLLILPILPVSINLAQGIVGDLHPERRGLAYVELPNRSRLYLNERDRKFIANLHDELGGLGIGPGGRAVVCYPNGEGIEYFLGFPRVGRHSHVEGVLVRPFERAEFFHEVLASAGFLLISKDTLPEYMRRDPKGSAVSIFSTFDDTQKRILSERLGSPIFFADQGVFIPIDAHQSAPSVPAVR